ncbi:hypothetical protein BDR03DRAFT_971400 [Suillus americanus]|nr:hypothetical protein BDR03DRAFT_971400 [Suillus americanus]
MHNRESKEASASVAQPSMNGDKQLAGSHQEPVKIFEGHDNFITSSATFPDGKRIVTGSADKTIRIWKLEDGTELKKWATNAVSALVISRNGKYVVSAEGQDSSDDKKDKKVAPQLWVRDAESGKTVKP